MCFGSIPEVGTNSKGREAEKLSFIISLNDNGHGENQQIQDSLQLATYLARYYCPSLLHPWEVTNGWSK
jgi:hypothetical protein